ncbi:MBL fold metallo-hydrolase [Alkalicoccus daliensis]|uniref:Glyoxylase, beta-lactamase superfamily II n=1 Tax=Alkalicoccus daliensis TaxID=745820 RepID=A0A1H0DA08_9BACI|nr:MBL fold metallo-hydrolase [Alkalicoccus daliensis]SDN66801.1 Glyoxylase, beta-lactamase superfamily II [Alkalicoccus daliensis]
MTVQSISAAEVSKKVVNKKPLFILDVRNEDAFADWKIEGESIEHLNKPYFDLLDGVEEIITYLPEEKEIVVACAKEGSSQMIAEMLLEEGVEAKFLEGGMKSWSEHLEPVKIGNLTDGAELFQFVRLGKGCLSYMVIADGEAAVIDATRMTDTFLNFAKEKNAVIKHVFDTHLHADHISGGRVIAEAAGAAYYLPPADAGEVTFDFQEITDGWKVGLGKSNVEIEALYTPGHTIGSTSFIVNNQYLLTGDILFIDSIGRPDLAGRAEDWVGDLRDSLYSRYPALAEELIVLPAHFMKMGELNNDGSVAKKLKDLFTENHGLNIKDTQEFRDMVTINLPPQPNAYEEIRKTNMGKITPEEEEQREMEIGPNRCAVR